MGLVRACRVDELPDGEALRLETEPPVALVNAGGQFFAVEDECSHTQFPLSEGWIDTEDATIECALHFSRFCLRTGVPQCLPATKPVRVFPVKVEGDEVFVVMQLPVGQGDPL